MTDPLTEKVARALCEKWMRRDIPEDEPMAGLWLDMACAAIAAIREAEAYGYDVITKDGKVWRPAVEYTGAEPLSEAQDSQPTKTGPKADESEPLQFGDDDKWEPCDCAGFSYEYRANERTEWQSNKQSWWSDKLTQRRLVGPAEPVSPPPAG